MAVLSLLTAALAASYSHVGAHHISRTLANSLHSLRLLNITTFAQHTTPTILPSIDASRFPQSYPAIGPHEDASPKATVDALLQEQLPLLTL